MWQGNCWNLLVAWLDPLEESAHEIAFSTNRLKIEKKKL